MMHQYKILATSLFALFFCSQSFALSCPPNDQAPGQYGFFSKAQLMIWTPPQFPQIKGSVTCFYQNPYNGNVYPYRSIPTPVGDSWRIKSANPVIYECVNANPAQCQYTLK